MQNGTQKSVEELVKVLNDAQVPGQDVVGEWVLCNSGTLRRQSPTLPRRRHHPLPLPVVAEVVVAPTFVHIPYTAANLRKDFAVSAQNCWVQARGGGGCEAARLRPCPRPERAPARALAVNRRPYPLTR